MKGSFELFSGYIFLVSGFYGFNIFFKIMICGIIFDILWKVIFNCFVIIFFKLIVNLGVVIF